MGHIKWYEIQDNIAYWKEFETSKLIVPAITPTVNFGIDFDNYVCNNKATIITAEPDECFWLAGILNSNVSDWISMQVCSSKQGGFRDFEPRYSEQLPTLDAPSEKKTVIQELVRRIHYLANLIDRESRDTIMLGYFEQLLNALVYELYFGDELHEAGLSPFELVSRSQPPVLDALPTATRLTQLREYFTTIYHIDHPIRSTLHALQSLDTVRIIEGKS